MTWYSVRIFTVSLSKDLSPLHYHVRETCLVVKVSWDRGGSGQRIRSCPSQSSGWSHWLTPLRPMKSAMGPLVIAPAIAPKVSMEPNNEYCKQTHQQTPKNKVLRFWRNLNVNFWNLNPRFVQYFIYCESHELFWTPLILYG